MDRSPRMHKRFDQSADFTVCKPFKLNGEILISGQSFDKSNCTIRRLRQLYDARYLTMEQFDLEALIKRAEAEIVKPVMPEFGTMSQDGLRIWLKENGVIARPRATLESLKNRAEALWKQKNEG